MQTQRILRPKTIEKPLINGIWYVLFNYNRPKWNPLKKVYKIQLTEGLNGKVTGTLMKQFLFKGYDFTIKGHVNYSKNEFNYKMISIGPPVHVKLQFKDNNILKGQWEEDETSNSYNLIMLRQDKGLPYKLEQYLKNEQKKVKAFHLFTISFFIYNFYL